MDKFIDSPNSAEIIKKLDTITDREEFQKYVEEILPNWLIYSIDEYCPDYPYLQQNWLHICRLNNVNPQKIVLVDDIIFDDNHTVLQHCCELLTQRGYVVRRLREYIVCHICEKAIPSREMWNMLTNNKALHIPKTWSETCSIHDEDEKYHN